MDEVRARTSGATDGDGTTIVAPATPPGTGAVSIVRLSGPDAFSIARRLTGVDPAGHLPRTLWRCTVRDASGDEIDSGLVVWFPRPHSFTGEDVVELHLHGAPVLVARTARAACDLGAAPARPGEFSRRAFDNGKIDLTQAEGLADLIASRTAASARAALRQLRGGIGSSVGPLREELVSLLTQLEASIDFGDEEDVALPSGSQIKERVSKIRLILSRLIASYDSGHRYRDGATVVIAGVANVGKSLLLNRILGEDRAIVTEVPGTTRDYLSAGLALSGLPVRLVDTAGLRESDDPIEREGVRRSRRVIALADLTLFVLDGSRPAHDGDGEAYAEVADRPHFLLLNKADLPAVESGERFIGDGRRGVFRISARTGEGIPEALSAAGRELGVGRDDIMAEAPLTRLRHVEAAGRADRALQRAEEGLDTGLPTEFLAADVRDAAHALSELTGAIAPDEVLDAIFDSFCIGK